MLWVRMHPDQLPTVRTDYKQAALTIRERLLVIAFASLAGFLLVACTMGLVIAAFFPAYAIAWYLLFKGRAYDQVAASRQRTAEYLFTIATTSYALFGVLTVAIAAFDNNSRILVDPIVLFGAGLLVLVVMIASCIVSAKVAARWDKKREYSCRMCGYDMRGLIDRCPECGAAFKSIALSRSMPIRRHRNKTKYVDQQA